MKGFVWTACAFVAISCLGSGTATASPANAPSACAHQAKSHIASLADAADAITFRASSGRLLIVGELHGTNESPELVRMLIDNAVAQGPVRLGLEMRISGQAAMEAFLHSPGSTTDRAKMFQSPFWDSKDGRSSTAMLQLIDRVRALRSTGADVDIFFMEPDSVGKVMGDEDYMAFKEGGMAKSIRRVLNAGAPNPSVIALMGNVHARYGESFKGMTLPTPSVTERLLAFNPYVVMPAARQTASWNCISEKCGVYDYTSPNAPKTKLPAFVTIKSPADATVVRLWLASMTASLPAKAQAATAAPPPPPL